MPKGLELRGQKFGRWEVLSQAKSNGSRRWNVICVCGNRKIVPSNTLTSGLSKSCGCLQKEIVCKLRTTHGATSSKNKGKNVQRLHRIWHHMKQRCDNKNHDDYPDYGGRGIKYCKRWGKFENFRDEMEVAFNEHMEEYGAINTTIDRIKNSKGYSKENCRWATQDEQANNRRSTILIEYKGDVKSMKQWAKILGIKYQKFTALIKGNVSIYEIVAKQ